MSVSEFDARQLIARFSDVERKKFPEILVRAINDSGFQVRTELMDELPRVFDRPAPLTLGAVLYKKASSTKQDSPTGEVFIRNEATKGTPPSKYLLPEVQGGTRNAKASERRLRAAGVLGPNEFWVIGRGAQEDASGNLPGGIVRAIISDLGASFDPLSNSTPASRAKRARRNRKRSGSGVYFVSRGPSGDRGDGRPQHLPRGIYERKTRGFVGPSRGGQSGVNLVMAIVSSVSYRPRFDIFGIARRRFYEVFPENFRLWMVRILGDIK